MKTLPTNIATEVVKDITVPFYIMELGFETILRYSTRQTVTFGGETFISGIGQVSKFSEMAATIILDNHDDAAAGYALNDNVRDRYIKIWAAYGELTALTTDDILQSFDGAMTNLVSITSTSVIINCAALFEKYLFSPRIYCGPPIHSFMIPAGTLIGNYTLDPS